MHPSKRAFTFYFAALTVLGVLAAVPAFAAPDDEDGGSSNRGGPRNRPTFEQWLEKHPEAKTRLDTNGDGTIDEAERRAGKQEMKDKRTEQWADNHPEWKKKWDANGDGTVDAAEMEQAKTAKKEHQEEKFSEWLKQHPEAAAQMDANKDGTVDATERQTFKREHENNRRRGPDRDNNPPGPAGGRGTNWENKPGPQGGPGASPDKKQPN